MLHSHCEACIVRSCTVKPDDVTSCAMVSCEHNCGAVFHRCLMSEHTLLCPEERVPCTNLHYGCPLLLPRRKVGVHLEVCPASVLCCPIEWNRWPMYSVEDKKKMPLPTDILKVNCGQLDMSLAMRDQRMLVESLNAPRKTKRILRNRLTTRYPAAPFSHRSSSMDSDMVTSEETSQDASDDEGGNTPWNLGNYPPGLQRSVCSRLLHATKQTTESLSATLDLASSHLTTSGRPLAEINECGKKTMSDVINPTQQVDASFNIQSNGASQVELLKGNTTELLKGSIITTNHNECLMNTLTCNTRLCDILGVDINIDCITKYQPKPAEMFTFLCAQEFRRDEYAWHFKNVHNDIQSCLNGWMEQRCPLSYLGCTFSFRRFKPNNGSSITHSALLESFGVASLQETSESPLRREPSDSSMDVSTANSSASSIAQTRHSPSDVDTMVTETTSGDRYSDFDYDHSPSLVQYSVNTTPVIHVEPEVQVAAEEDDAAVAGETTNIEVFTSYRAYSPIDVKTRLFRPTPHRLRRQGLHLLNLPFEVLQEVARHLDSFSVCNLAVVCKLLRDVCCSLLDERGIVIQVWEKVKDADHKVVWRSFCNTWRFSTAFTPVKNWHFNGHNPIGDHLKTCHFNQEKIIRDSPFFVYPPGDAPMDHGLRSLLAERQRESVSVKLRELHQWYQEFQDARAEHDDDDDDPEDPEPEEIMLRFYPPPPL